VRSIAFAGGPVGPGNKVLGEPAEWPGHPGQRRVAANPGWAPAEPGWAPAEPGWAPAEAGAPVAASGLAGGSCLASPDCGECPKSGKEPGVVGSNTENSAGLPGCPGRAKPVVRQAATSGLLAMPIPGGWKDLTRVASILKAGVEGVSQSRAGRGGSRAVGSRQRPGLSTTFAHP
jgi:hypothetical protein